MKNKEINKLTNDELNNKVNLIKKDLFNFRFRKINGQLQDTSKISQLKRDIAKILTSQEYNKFKYIIILTLLMFFLETISLVSIPLFATVLLNESILFENYKFLNNINLIKDAGQARLIFYCGILVIFSFVVKNLFLVFLIYFQGNFQKKMKINISKKLFEHYIRMPFLNHLEKNPANLSRYVSNEISGFNMYLQSLTLLLRESIAIVVIFLLLIST